MDGGEALDAIFQGRDAIDMEIFSEVLVENMVQRKP